MKHKFFEKARQLSKRSNHRQHQLACVIVKGNRIVSYGWNQLKTTPVAKNKYNMLHAEIHALIGQSVKGCTAYVYREHRNETLAMSKPCPSCELALREAGIKKVYYTKEGGYDSQKF